MNTLREAVQEYVLMRRDLGFKLHDAGKGLLDFVTFMEHHRASYITQALALAWAQQPSNVQPAHWARRLSFEDLRIIAARPIHARRFRRRAFCRSSRNGRDHICTQMPRYVACCAPLSTCHAAMNAAGCGLGSITVSSGC